MSTGLTYVTITDLPGETPENAPAVQVFNSYSEAYEYGDYLGNFDQYKNHCYIIIWTSGPNQNGIWVGDPWSFSPID